MLTDSASLRDSILAVLKLFNEHFVEGIPREGLETSITPAKAHVSPLYNYDMSMEGTLDRVINHTIDYSKEFGKLETLKQRIRRNPHDKTAQKQYAELSQETGSPNPFRNLRKSFDDDNAALDKLARRKATEEEIQEARHKLEEYANRYASIADKTLSGVQQVANESRDKTAIFVEGKAED